MQSSVENYQSKAVEQVKPHFSKQFVYYVGSHEGCGCGFRQEDYSFQEDNEELKKMAENHQYLFEYIVTCLKDENSIELYACWAGSENEPSKSKKEIVISEIVKDDFFFNEDELIVVEK